MKLAKTIECWSSDGNGSPIAVLGVMDNRDTTSQVDVIPSQRKELGSPHARRDREQNEEVQVVVLAPATRIEQASTFVVVEEADSPLGLLGSSDVAAGIRRQPLQLSDAMSKDSRERGQIAVLRGRACLSAAATTTGKSVSPLGDQPRTKICQGVASLLPSPPLELLPPQVTTARSEPLQLALQVLLN